ncbi:MAG: hypothetical protein ACREQ5_10325 [Candidatus Dormibacteria bacterium]
MSSRSSNRQHVESDATTGEQLGLLSQHRDAGDRGGPISDRDVTSTNTRPGSWRARGLRSPPTPAPLTGQRGHVGDIGLSFPW